MTKFETAGTGKMMMSGPRRKRWLDRPGCMVIFRVGWGSCVVLLYSIAVDHVKRFVDDTRPRYPSLEKGAAATPIEQIYIIQYYVFLIFNEIAT